MKAERPIIGAVLALAAGLSLIFVYCNGTTGFNVAYPFSASTLHLDITTTGPAVLGGLVLTAIGVLLLAWAFLVAIVCQIGLLAGRDKPFERIVERYPEGDQEISRYDSPAVAGERKHTLL